MGVSNEPGSSSSVLGIVSTNHETQLQKKTESTTTKELLSSRAWNSGARQTLYHFTVLKHLFFIYAAEWTICLLCGDAHRGQGRAFDLQELKLETPMGATAPLGVTALTAESSLQPYCLPHLF